MNNQPIETKEDWWSLVNDNWSKLFSILAKFLPLENIEKICPKASREMITSTEPMSVAIIKAKESREKVLVGYFFKAYVVSIFDDDSWEISGFNLFTNLLAKRDVLQ